MYRIKVFWISTETINWYISTSRRTVSTCECTCKLARRLQGPCCCTRPAGTCPLTRRSWQWCSQRGTRGCRHRCGWRTRCTRHLCAPSPACICCEGLGRKRRRRSASFCRWRSCWDTSPRRPLRAGGLGRPRSGWLSRAWGSRRGTARGSTGRPWCTPGVCNGQGTLSEKRATGKGHVNGLKKNPKQNEKAAKWCVRFLGF